MDNVTEDNLQVNPPSETPVPAPEAAPLPTEPLPPPTSGPHTISQTQEPMTPPLASAAQPEQTSSGTTAFAPSTWPPIPEKKPASPNLRRPWLVLLLALAAAFFLDLITYKQQAGIQWAVFVGLAILGSLSAAFIEKRSVPPRSYILVGMLGLSGVLTLFRGEGYTQVSLVLFGLLALVLLAGSLLNGEWARFRVREYFRAGLDVFLSAVIGLPVGLTEGARKTSQGESKVEKHGSGAAAAVVRGILISLPLLFIFAMLLGSADVIFGSQLKKLVSWLSIRNLEDAIRQMAVILILTWGLFGVLWMLITHSDKHKVPDKDAPLVKPFLGLTESAVVMISVNLLLAAFLLVQFRYFFAGKANITLEGFTYAEYARRGFFELLAVGFIAWFLHYALSSVTRREKTAQRFIFSLLASLLILQVGLVLVSAFQRLSLYEQAYGFTRDRLVAHVVMVFLGLVLLLSMLMEWTRSLKRMALVLFTSLFAFALTLAAVNVDALIVRRNLDRAVQGKKFDPAYLVNDLASEDAVPTMFRYYDDPTLPKDLKNTLGKVLVCRQAWRVSANGTNRSWTGWTWPGMRADALYAAHASALAGYKMTQQDDMLGFQLGDTWVMCEFAASPGD